MPRDTITRAASHATPQPPSCKAAW